MQEYIEKAAVLIQALPYIQRFRDAVVVVKFGGSAMEVPEYVENTLRDIVFMECVGMKPVVVHGGGKAISAMLAKRGIETRFVDGMRYTCEQTVAVADDVLRSVNRELVTKIDDYGGAARGVSGTDVIAAEALVRVDRTTGAPLELGQVGRITEVNVEPIQTILDAAQVPVITPLGTGSDGRLYNINADVSACRIAAALKARKLVFLSDVPGLLRNPEDVESLISTIYLDEVDEYIESGVITGGMLPKIESAVEALKEGTNKVHLVDGRIQHSLLLEIFTDDGVGTQIVKHRP